MKKTLILLSFAIGISTYTNAQNVTIPDANFKAYLVGNSSINTNADAEIQITEANSFTGTINCPSLSIADLTGLEEFTMLTQLNCLDNQLSALNLNNNQNLSVLSCDYNNLSNLDLSNNLGLISISCGSNILTSLDVSNNLSLEFLAIEQNQLTTLDVSLNTMLSLLNCWGNQLSNIDVSNNTSLTYLGCSSNPISNLDLSNNAALEELYCGNNMLTSLDLSNNTSLIKLSCESDQLTALNISSNIALKELTCDNLLFTNMDLSSNVLLEQVSFRNNPNLESLDLVLNTAVTSLYCMNNTSLSSLNISNGNNQILFSANMTGNPSLTCIEVDDITFANSQGQWQKDAIASYSEDCNSTIGITNKEALAEWVVYPNPVVDILHIKSNIYFDHYQLVNMLGVVINSNKIFNNQLDLIGIQKGIYTLVLTSSGVKDSKIVIVE